MKDSTFCKSCKDDVKVKGLKDSIVEECRKQGFTLNEFERLVTALQWEAEKVRREAFAKASF